MTVMENPNCRKCQYFVSASGKTDNKLYLCNYCFATYSRRGCRVEDCEIWKSHPRKENKSGGTA